MQIECQIILFRLLLLIYHKYPAIAKRGPLLYLLLVFNHPSLLLLLLIWYTVIGGEELHKEERGEMIMVVVHVEDRGYTM